MTWSPRREVVPRQGQKRIPLHVRDPAIEPEGRPDYHQGIVADLIEAGAIALVITPDGHPLVWIHEGATP